jgi:hypothetical protein
MPKNRSISELPQIIATVEKSSQLAVVNGQRVVIGSTEFAIQAGNQVLAPLGITAPPDPKASLNLLAFNMLFSLGVTLSHEKKSYSLLDDQTDTQIVENIAIFDPIYDTLTNKAVEAKDKFSNNKDPFYELDEAPPKDETKRREKIIEDKLTPRVEKITAEIVKINMSDPTTPTLKQFKNSKDLI